MPRLLPRRRRLVASLATHRQPAARHRRRRRRRRRWRRRHCRLKNLKWKLLRGRRFRQPQQLLRGVRSCSMARLTHACANASKSGGRSPKAATPSRWQSLKAQKSRHHRTHGSLSLATAVASRSPRRPTLSLTLQRRKLVPELPTRLGRDYG